MTAKELKTNNMGYTPYKMKASGHNNSPIEKNYGSKSDRGFGVPFTGGVGSNEMESGVGDKFEGMPYSENASPAKGLFGAIGNIFKKGAKKVGGALGGAVGGMLGLAKKGKGGGGGAKIKAMDDRISALEEGMSAGGEGELPTTDPITGMTMGGVGGAAANTATMGAVDAGAVLSGAGMSGSTKPLMAEMMKKKKMKAGWGGLGEAQAV